MRKTVNITYPDYERIRNESCRINCTVTEKDFDTYRPNPLRIDYIARDIGDYRKRCKITSRTLNAVR